MEEKVKVVYFSKTSVRGPSSRYRIYQFLPYLEAAGIECSVRPLLAENYFSLLEIQNSFLRAVGKMIYVGTRFLRRAWDLITLGRQDIIVIEGQLFPYCPSWPERVLRWFGARLVFEYDDAIYLTPFHQQKIPSLIQLSAGVVVGNHVLATYAKQFTSNVTVIPTVVDTNRFIPLRLQNRGDRRRSDRPVTVVWIGLAYNFPFLEVLVPALQRVQREVQARFRVVSSRPPNLPGINVEFVPWEFQTEVASLQESHIGVMPLPDTEWARAKSGLKLLQYMAVGIAAIASPVGVNEEIITPGENGLLASTSEEWSDRLLRLCCDADLRIRLAEAGRRTVEERYALKLWGPRLAQTYRMIADRTGFQEVGPSFTQSVKRCA